MLGCLTGGAPSAADCGKSQQVEDECEMWADAENEDDQTAEESGPDYGPPSTCGKSSLIS